MPQQPYDSQAVASVGRGGAPARVLVGYDEPTVAEAELGPSQSNSSVTSASASRVVKTANWLTHLDLDRATSLWEVALVSRNG
ncbi:hypothetical protein [Streptomyces sp. NPDC059010]|uniref:hypothetical protein n=1 Tax=Streptomyces sp. NPDC059010 TaxID=3346695 RepID=UPI00369494C7